MVCAWLGHPKGFLDFGGTPIVGKPCHTGRDVTLSFFGSSSSSFWWEHGPPGATAGHGGYGPRGGIGLVVLILIVLLLTGRIY